MTGEQSGLRERRTMPREVPELTLVAKRVLDGRAWRPVRAEFRFDPATPMIVSMTLVPARGPSVVWRIGRGLLHQGFFEESGEGYVQVWPVPGQEGVTVRLLLESRQSSAVLELPVPALAHWIESTYEIVPAHAEGESLNWDGFISALLNGSGRNREDES
ncbi:SsgA family sporulation/cell division regulator [Kitasatospora sp. NPDC057223]|uniref:SsgA family sporulation/cell division regulator n=1 Tax=Kitasatospora sp. NPDC057223 TaxID=3346055 RepID=UPI0036273D00